MKATQDQYFVCALNSFRMVHRVALIIIYQEIIVLNACIYILIKIVICTKNTITF